MTINFIGLFGNSGTGEISDENHLARELERLGHTVRRVPRDQWKAHCDGHKANEDWILPEKADLNIICKWPHFNDAKYTYMLRGRTSAPVWYWSWDYFGWPDVPNWHKKMAETSDLHLTNELGDFDKMGDRIKPYYFPMDVCDGDHAIHHFHKKYDVTFFGSFFEVGGRLDLLNAVKDKFHLTVFSPNYLEWEKRGFNAKPAVWGNELNKVISESKICIQIGVNNNCYGYWSNRVGKILYAGGFMLAKFVPGMEVRVGDSAVYFKNVQEALEKIDFYLNNEQERIEVEKKAKELGTQFTSACSMKQLSTLIENYGI